MTNFILNCFAGVFSISFGSKDVIVQKEPFAACTSVPRSICPSLLGVADSVGKVEDKVALEGADDSEGSEQKVEGDIIEPEVSIASHWTL